MASRESIQGPRSAARRRRAHVRTSRWPTSTASPTSSASRRSPTSTPSTAATASTDTGRASSSRTAHRPSRARRSLRARPRTTSPRREGCRYSCRDLCRRVCEHRRPWPSRFFTSRSGRCWARSFGVAAVWTSWTSSCSCFVTSSRSCAARWRGRTFVPRIVTCWRRWLATCRAPRAARAWSLRANPIALASRARAQEVATAAQPARASTCPG
jgi:hypothetical protein